MHKFRTAILAAVALTFGTLLAGAPASAAPRTLPRFESEADLVAYLKKHIRTVRGRAFGAGASDDAVASMPAPAPSANAPGAESVVVTGPKAGEDSITNNQESGVDEGDIVKLRGDTLVILRRGRLFTVSIAGGAMKPIDSINAYPPGVNANSDWYDEMLVSGDRVIVIGYSYGRGGTEINRFRLGANGKLKFEDAYQLRSNDYYSSRNYASRMIGTHLVLYSPRYLPWNAANALDALPGLRRWTGDTNGGFKRIGTAREVYLSPGMPDEQIATVHTVTNCDVTAPVLNCKATSVFGPEGRTFYVSGKAVYVWVTPWWSAAPRGRAPSMLYRLPLDGGAPSAMGVHGSPTDQMSFREDGGILNVLVRANSAGEGMWAAEFSAGAVGLLRLPIGSMGDGTQAAPLSRYRSLPTPLSDREFHNRFVGNYVLYGVGNGWGTPSDYHSTLIAAPLTGGQPARLRLPHGTDRIEVMGRDAVVVGSDSKSVYFSTVDLSGGPDLGSRYVLEAAAQGETRSHAFFYRPDSADGRTGVLGMPVARQARPAYRQLFENSAAMVFLRRTDGIFSKYGEIAANDSGAVDDKCVASCVDWYGNARPIFARGRIFALMGYELVEGSAGGRAIREVGRVNYAPRNHREAAGE